MFDDLQRIFRKSIAAFRTEVSREAPEDEVASLLTAMRREWVAARAELPLLEENLRRAAVDLARERELLEQCERRGKLAERVADAETVRIAGEFAARHREKISVLERKVGAAEAEKALRVREVEEMKRRYQEADDNRFALLAELRRARSRTRTRETAEQVGGAFEDFARMEERVGEGADYADALDADLGTSGTPPPARPATDVEERLRELKRRMGEG